MFKIIFVFHVWVPASPVVLMALDHPPLYWPSGAKPDGLVLGDHRSPEVLAQWPAMWCQSLRSDLAALCLGPGPGLGLSSILLSVARTRWAQVTTDLDFLPMERAGRPAPLSGEGTSAGCLQLFPPCPPGHSAGLREPSDCPGEGGDGSAEEVR